MHTTAYAAEHRSSRMLGHLCTTWGAVKVAELAEFAPLCLAAASLS